MSKLFSKDAWMGIYSDQGYKESKNELMILLVTGLIALGYVIYMAYPIIASTGLENSTGSVHLTFLSLHVILGLVSLYGIWKRKKFGFRIMTYLVLIFFYRIISADKTWNTNVVILCILFGLISIFVARVPNILYRNYENQ